MDLDSSFQIVVVACVRSFLIAFGVGFVARIDVDDVGMCQLRICACCQFGPYRGLIAVNLSIQPKQFSDSPGVCVMRESKSR